MQRLRPTWLSAPSDLLTRVRWLLLCVNLIACALVLPLGVLPAPTGWLLRGLAALALLWLALRALHVYRTRAPWGLALGLEGLLLLLVGLIVENLLAVRGLTNSCLALRALYGSPRQVALVAAVYATALLGSAALSSSPLADLNAPPQAATGVASLLITATLMHVLATTAERYDAAQAEVQRLNADLEHRVHERTAQLEAANRELQSEVVERRQAEAALRASETRYRTLVETSSDAILLTDLDANVLLCNEAGAALVGAPNTAALVGRNAFEFIAPPERERATTNLQHILTHGRIRTVEHTLRRTDGSTVPVELSASLALDAANQPQHLVAIVRDVSARQQAEAERQQAQEWAARLDGIMLAAREIGHLLNNDLAIAIVAMDVLHRQPALSPDVQALLTDASDGLVQAEAHIRRFQQVVRVEVKETPLGPALDLERSAPPV